MGVIRNQTILGGIFSYIGVGLGFITVGLIWPKFLSTEQIGLINLLLAQSAVLSHFGTLGLNSVTLKLFPHFRNKKTNHNGYLFLVLCFVLAGSILVIVYIFLFKNQIIENNLEKSELFNQYFNYLIPFTLFTLLFNVIDTLCKALFKAVIGTFSKEFISRIVNLILVTAYIFIGFPFKYFMLGYTINLSIPIIILIYALVEKHEFNLSPSFNFVTQKLKKDIISVALFALIGGLGSIAISSIDKIMINRFLGLQLTGIYSINYLFASIITLPSKSLSRIATTVIAEAWKNKNQRQILEIYQKSCISQMIIAIFIFIFLWINIETLFIYLPDEYSLGKFVVLYIALAGIFDMSTGLNGMIIATSKYYRFQIWFIIVLCIGTIGFNLIFIPKYGMVGAAFASFLSTIIYNLSRLIFLAKIYNMYPFKFKYVLILLVPLIIILTSKFLDVNPFIRFFTSLGIASAFILVSYKLKLSEDINKSLYAFIKHIKK